MEDALVVFGYAFPFSVVTFRHNADTEALSKPKFYNVCFFSS
jgi:hypothetical protein